MSGRVSGRVLGLGPLLLAAAALGGCYNPKIPDGGFACAEAGKLCPDGFVCSVSDHRCHKPGFSPDAALCTLGTATPVCDTAPAAGDACNPTCQSGCSCGRCNVSSGGAAVCTAVGTRGAGESCLPNADNCAAGFYCWRESCGNTVGRCRQHCTTNADCPAGLFCQNTIPNSGDGGVTHLVCDAPPVDCDPISNTGCPNPAFTCYLSNTSTSETLCDCPGPGHGVLEECAFYNDCQKGLVCISNVGGLIGPHCHPICLVASPTCAAPATCVATSPGAKYGVCSSS